MLFYVNDAPSEKKKKEEEKSRGLSKEIDPHTNEGSNAFFSLGKNMFFSLWVRSTKLFEIKKNGTF